VSPVAGKSPDRLQFGVFEVDLRHEELRKNGNKIKLQALPFQFLAALLERPGQVVTREDLARRLWSGAIVDFDSGLNTAAKKLREALDDDAATPRYVETLPRRGYRFIAPVQSREERPKEVPRAAEPRVQPPYPPSPPRHWRYLITAAAVAIIVLFPLYRLSVPARPPRVLDVVQLTQTGRVEVANGIATDGSRVFFTERNGGRWSLAQVSVHGGVPQPLPSTELLTQPDIIDISPDRSSLLVASQNNVEAVRPLWVVPIVGGTPHRLGDVIAQAGAWSRDGSQIVYARGSALFLVNSDGTGSRKLVDTPGLTDGIRWAPAPAPDVLRLSIIGPDVRAGALWEVASSGAGLHLLLRNWKPAAAPPDGETSGTWTAGGKLYLFRSRRGAGTGIWAMTADRGLLGNGGHAVQIYSTPHELSWLTPAPDGKRIFFAAGQERRELVRYDLRRRQFMPYLPGVPGRWVDFSKDGQWVAYTSAPQEALWRSRADGRDPVQLTSRFYVAQPHWSPDGTRIAFSGGQTGLDGKVYVIPAAGGAPEPVATGPFIASDASWSPDGKSLVFARDLLPLASNQVGLCVIDSKTRQTRFLPGSEGLTRAAWSPDPRYLAATNVAGAQIQLLDFSTGQWTPLAAGKGLGVPIWSADAQYIYYQEVLGGPEQPIFRVQIHTRKIEKMMGASQIPQSNLTGYVMTGMGPGDEPVATALRSNSDIYALDLDAP
jgi:Tol biopolymer transport system component/DNA-binding winged helix-turn-helix (wHTH) protein